MQERTHKKSWVWQIVCLCCLASIVAGCGQLVEGGAAAVVTAGSKQPESVMSTPAENETMPATQTDCPETGTARAAVMRPLRPGTAPTVVYVFNDVPPRTSTANGRLMRVGVVPADRIEIVHSGISIKWAQVSTDGAWVLFLSTPDPRGDSQHSGMLQLVRMDGQGLQTLYCIPNNASKDASNGPNIPPNIQWSENQKSVLISTDSKDTTSTLTLLNLASGTLKTLLNITDTQQLYRYSLLTWLNNDKAYILKSGRQGPAPPVTLYLLNTKTSHDLQGGNLQKILESPARFRNLSFDSSYDGKKLFFSNCLQAASPFDQTIEVGPATGGTFQTLYHQAQTVCVNTLRIGLGQKLLMTGIESDSQGNSYTNKIWTMKPDGTAWQSIYSLPKPANQSESFSLNVYSQFPWSNFSRDGNEFTFLQKNQDTGVQRLWYEPINGGIPHILATTPTDATNSSLYMVGWTLQG